MRMLICFIIALLITLSSLATACTIPTGMIGTWKSSDVGSMELNSTHLINYSIYNKGGQTFTCFEQSGTYYAFKSGPITVFNAVLNAALCVEFTYLNGYMYKYTVKTSKLTQADNQRFMFVSTTTTLTAAMVCDDTSNTDFNLMVDSSAAVSSLSIACPTQFLGVFSYVSNITTGGECNGTGSLNVCTDSSKMSFNYTACSKVQAYSAGGKLNCIYSTSSGSSTKVVMYNLDSTTDESSTYRFMCYVVESSYDGNIYATQYPKNCYSGQTSTSVSRPGGSVVFTASSTCVPTTTSGLTAGASAGIAIAVILILLLLLLILGFCIYKKTRKVDPGPPSPSPPELPDQGVPPASTAMPIDDKSRPDFARNFFHAKRVLELPDIEKMDKVPRLERQFTQHSTMRQQIVTPSVVNPMVREWTDMEDSDDITLIHSDMQFDRYQRTPTPPEHTSMH